MSTFICEACGGEFTGNPEAAEQEFSNEFPSWQDFEHATVCTDCYEKITAWAERLGLPR